MDSETVLSETTYRDALRRALYDSMREDARIVVIGEDVGRYGGAYGVTKDLIGEFGEARLIDTPISEPAIVGAAIGAAMTGLRPVAELMYVDFLGLVMDQLANQAAKIRLCSAARSGCRWFSAPRAEPGARPARSIRRVWRDG